MPVYDGRGHARGALRPRHSSQNLRAEAPLWNDMRVSRESIHELDLVSDLEMSQSLRRAFPADMHESVQRMSEEPVREISLPSRCIAVLAGGHYLP